MSDKYTFDNTWFAAVSSIWDNIFDQLCPSRYLEIGSFDGASACYAIERIGEKEGGTVTCIDPWDLDYNVAQLTKYANMEEVLAAYEANVAVAVGGTPNPVHTTTYREKSSVTMPRLLVEGGPEQFDFIYIDGDHTAATVMLDAVLAFQLLLPGGILAFDDYLWGQSTLPTLQRPKTAIDAFVNSYAGQMVVLEAPLRQLYLLKPKRK